MEEFLDDFEASGEISRKKRIRRSKKLINNEIMKAVSQVIGEQGFGKLGINSVAIQAKVEKPFIYRNFGTFDKVLEEYILKNDYWMKFIIQRAFEGKSDSAGNQDLHGIFTNLLTELYKTMDESRDFRNIILWELYEDTPFIRKTAQRREAETRDEVGLLHTHFQNANIDIEAITSILISGIYYLVLHKNISTFCGIDFKTKEGKKRMIEALKFLSNVIFDQAEKNKAIITRMLKKGLDINLISEVTEVPVSYVEKLSKEIN